MGWSRDLDSTKKRDIRLGKMVGFVNRGTPHHFFGNVSGLSMLAACVKCREHDDMSSLMQKYLLPLDNTPRPCRGLQPLQRCISRQGFRCRAHKPVVNELQAHQHLFLFFISGLVASRRHTSWTDEPPVSLKMHIVSGFSVSGTAVCKIPWV